MPGTQSGHNKWALLSLPSVSHEQLSQALSLEVCEWLRWVFLILTKGTTETRNQHLPVHLLPGLSLYPPIHPSIYQLKQLFIDPSTQLPTHPSTHPPTTLLIHPFIHPSDYHPVYHPSISQPQVLLSVRLSMYPSHPPIHPSVLSFIIHPFRLSHFP